MLKNVNVPDEVRRRLNKDDVVADGNKGDDGAKQVMHSSSIDR